MKRIKGAVSTWPRRVAAVIGAVAVGAGVAYAAWLITASGTGTSKIGSLSALTITEDTTAAAAQPLYPGQSVPLFVKVTNPNAVTMYLATTGQPIAVGQASLTITGSQGSCDPAAYLTASTYFSPSIPIPPSTTTSVAIPGVITLAANAPTGCEGGSVHASVDAQASTTNS
jgi:hypothetical protein